MSVIQDVNNATVWVKLATFVLEKMTQEILMTHVVVDLVILRIKLKLVQVINFN
jgi:hypothetical protein